MTLYVPQKKKKKAAFGLRIEKSSLLVLSRLLVNTQANDDDIDERM